ncbi:glycine zipper domain-containing protein [Castellaniella sp. FW104-16D08]|uniref:glycine zipper domain-containing protein n=1 Tax=unclassified Castellaniella TaxID=2617606 RepID=UPI003314EB35
MTRVGSTLLAFTLVLTGCASNISPNAYSVSSVGQVNRSVAATVVSVRDVDVTGTVGVGATTGVAAGATAGSAIGGGTRSNILGAIGGAVIGGLAGAAIERNATEQRAVEYVVETSNGNLMTLVQGPTPRFAEGNKVLVLYGSQSRLVADPRHSTP